jgi:NDP-sugar pyrophosphorylase family protein
MRAVIDCTGGIPDYRTVSADSFAMPDVSAGYNGLLMPLVDRPFLQHVLEKCVSLGVSRAEIIVDNDGAEDEIRKILGTGRRWGCSITYHINRCGSPLISVAEALTGSPADPCLVASAHCIPTLGTTGSNTPVVYIDRLTGEWTGWAMTNCASATSLCLVGFNTSGATLIRGLCAINYSEHMISCDTPGALLKAQRLLLEGKAEGLLITGREIKPGVRFGRNAQVHPTATLIAPVYVGENCRIGAGVTLGPNSVICRDCIIDRGNIVEESLICSGTFVGEELEVRSALIHGNLVINTQIGSATEVTDPCLLSRLPAA